MDTFSNAMNILLHLLSRAPQSMVHTVLIHELFVYQSSKHTVLIDLFLINARLSQ